MATKQDTRERGREFTFAFFLLPPSAFQSRLSKRLFASWGRRRASGRSPPMFSCFSHGQTITQNAGLTLSCLIWLWAKRYILGIHRRQKSWLLWPGWQIPMRIQLIYHPSPLSSLSYRVSRPRHSPACLFVLRRRRPRRPLRPLARVRSTPPPSLAVQTNWSVK